MSDSSYVKQKASKWTPFVFIALLICAQTVNAENCTAEHFQETAKVTHVYDGDTIKLADGRKLRLIGVNTPERGRDGQKDQPFYLSAKNQLQQIIKNNQNQLNIVLGKEKHDRYKRLLAHIFTTNGENISATLLKKGLGFSIAIPPNIQFLKCYKKAEREAQNHKRGIWGHPFSKTIKVSSISKSTSPKSILGFQRVTGTVQRVDESRSSFWLNLNKNFALRVLKKDLPYFKKFHPKTLLNQRLTAQGWIYQKIVNSVCLCAIRHRYKYIILTEYTSTVTL